MLLLDNSAFARLSSPRLAPARAETIAEQIRRREIAVCLPFLLEAGYAARNAADHTQLLRRLRRLVHLPVTADVEARALDAQAELARAGHHRIPPVDLIIAAIAHEHEVGVLHYDADYDLIVSLTGLRFHSEWLAVRGSI